MIYSFEEDRLCERESMIEALGLGNLPVKTRRPVVSVVGAGGKTTLLHRLAEEYRLQGTAPVVTTTTHIWRENFPFFLKNPSMKEIRKCMIRYGQVWAGTDCGNGKLAGLPLGVLKQLLKQEFPVLIEADGARMLPAKVPADHEPVILPCSTHVIYVCGMDSVGRKIKEAVFRPELAAEILNKTTEDPVEADDIAVLASSEQAGRKRCPHNAAYAVVLNKADNEERIREASDICRKIRKKGIGRVIVTSLRK